MQKASNIKDIYSKFDNQKAIDESSREFYVDIYKKILNELKMKLLLNENPTKTFYVAGQKGSGKSSALNLLRDENLESEYLVKYIRAKDLSDSNDIDIIDILLISGYELIKDNQTLEKEYLIKLEKIRKAKIKKYQEIDEETDTQLTQIGANIKSGVSSKVGILDWLKFTFDSMFFTKYKGEDKLKKIVREMFAIDKSELIEDLNSIIEKYREINGVNKRLLLIFDDLEKMQDKSQIDSVFKEHGYIFDKLNCVKILTLPIYLASKGHFNDDLYKFSIRVNNNQIDKKDEELDKEALNNREVLKDVIRKRLDSQNLIEEDALKKAILYSGGNVRTLIMIIRNSAIKALSEDFNITSIRENHIEEVKLDMQNNFAIGSRTKTLNYVLENSLEPKGENENEFIDSLLDNSVYAYFNGTPWFEVNPLAIDIVKVYAKKLQDEL